MEGKLTAADAWKNQVGDHFEIKQNSEGDWMIVAGGTSVEGSGLNVSAKNLVSKIFAGERSTGRRHPADQPDPLHGRLAPGDQQHDQLRDGSRRHLRRQGHDG